MIKIVSESSVAAGVRRIEAYTGARVEELMDTIEDTIRDLKALFNNAPDLAGTIRKYIEENAGLKKQMEDFMREKEAQIKERLLKNMQEIHGIKVIKICAPIPAESIKNIAFQLRGEIPRNLDRIRFDIIVYRQRVGEGETELFELQVELQLFDLVREGDQFLFGSRQHFPQQA